MTATTRSLHQGELKPRQLEALAFYLGAHDIDPAPVKEEIEARFAQEASGEKQEPLRALHALEAKLQQARKERPEAEAVWENIRAQFGDTPPPYFQAILMACCAVFALLLDTLFLAPTMDILNIPNPALQFIAAFGFAVLCTVYFEMTGLLYIGAKGSLPKRLTAIGVGAVGVVSLSVWGLLRGYQMRSAAGLAGNPLGQFLAEHPLLASVFYIFITLVTPALGATALLMGWQEVSRARTWRKVREKFEKLRTDEIQHAHDIQAEQEHLDKFDERKQHECREWRAIFDQFYKRGQMNGARKETLSSVLRKSALGGVCASPLAFLLPFALVPELVGIATVVGMALFAYFNHRRHHPSHERYLAQENTQFAMIPDAPQPLRELRAPQQRLLTKGDDSDDHDELRNSR
jgi:hypothetical protein